MQTWDVNGGAFIGISKKNPQILSLQAFDFVCIVLGGGRGIRTPGPVTVNGFQDRLVKPL